MHIHDSAPLHPNRIDGKDLLFNQRPINPSREALALAKRLTLTKTHIVAAALAFLLVQTLHPAAAEEKASEIGVKTQEQLVAECRKIDDNALPYCSCVADQANTKENNLLLQYFFAVKQNNRDKSLRLVKHIIEGGLYDKYTFLTDKNKDRHLKSKLIILMDDNELECGKLR